MNKNDMIRMAREAGWQYVDGDDGYTPLWRFAALVISHHVNETRPNISAGEEKWLQQIAYQHGGIGDLASHELEFGAMVAAAEREECAKIVDRWHDGPSSEPEMAEIAAEIRARGNSEKP